MRRRPTDEELAMIKGHPLPIELSLFYRWPRPWSYEYHDDILVIRSSDGATLLQSAVMDLMEARRLIDIVNQYSE